MTTDTNVTNLQELYATDEKTVDTNVTNAHGFFIRRMEKIVDTNVTNLHGFLFDG